MTEKTFLEKVGELASKAPPKIVVSKSGDTSSGCGVTASGYEQDLSTDEAKEFFREFEAFYCRFHDSRLSEFKLMSSVARGWKTWSFRIAKKEWEQVC